MCLTILSNFAPGGAFSAITLPSSLLWETRVAEGGTYAAATSYPSINVVGYSTGLSGSQTRKVKSNFIGITAATTLAAADYPSVIIVEDIGPA